MFQLAKISFIEFLRLLEDFFCSYLNVARAKPYIPTQDTMINMYSYDISFIVIHLDMYLLFISYFGYILIKSITDIRGHY